MPVNIAFAGGNTYGKARQMVDLERLNSDLPHQRRCRGLLRMRTRH